MKIIECQDFKKWKVHDDNNDEKNRLRWLLVASQSSTVGETENEIQDDLL